MAAHRLTPLLAAACLAGVVVLLAGRSPPQLSSRIQSVSALRCAQMPQLRARMPPAPRSVAMRASGAIEGRPIYSSMLAKLTEELVPAKLVITDDSKGHVEHEAMKGLAAESGETHFTVEVVSDKFEGVSLVKRHRMIYEIVKAELDAGVHALSLKTKTPKEAGI
uniref:BolA-like protein n=1 Tax=Lotharella globosa TaxID=91324 RepID=A0A7S4DGY9_9EUKA